jgi:hypothetical protein
MIPALKAIVERHIEDNVPVIIEGDFIFPEFTLSFSNPNVKCICVVESEKDQIIKNYLAREGGDLQNYRAEISIVYGEWIKNECNQQPRPEVEPAVRRGMLFSRSGCTRRFNTFLTALKSNLRFGGVLSGLAEQVRLLGTNKMGIRIIESRPWENLLERAIDNLEKQARHESTA